MNGRIYDPEIGRFLSADPHIQHKASVLSYNRYAYVNNNPLSYTDPSGYFIKRAMKSFGNFMNKYARVIIVVGVTVVTAGTGSIIAAALGGFYSAALMGATTPQALLTGAALGGYMAVNNINWGIRALVNGSINGALSKAQGENFERAFISGAAAGVLSKAAQVANLYESGSIGDILVSATIGGTVSEIGGGKFANGAATSAFSAMLGAMAARNRNSDTLDISEPAMSKSEIGSDARRAGNGKYVGYGKEEVLRPTGGVRTEWEGVDNMIWNEIPVDPVIELFIRRPVPSMSIQWGMEKGFSSYEYQVGYQKYQYTVQDLDMVNKSYIGGVEWTNETRWNRIDTLRDTNYRFRTCIGGYCQ